MVLFIYWLIGFIYITQLYEQDRHKMSMDSVMDGNL